MSIALPEDAVKRTREAYNALRDLPGVREHLAGKIGLVWFKHNTYTVNVAWLRDVGMAWVGGYIDFDPDFLASILKKKKVNAVPHHLNTKSATIMQIVEMLARREHPVAQAVLCKKAAKAHRAAEGMGFDYTMMYRLNYAWNIHYHLSSPRVLVFTSLYNYTYAGVSPNMAICIQQACAHRLRLIDVYKALINRGVGDAFDLVADTPEKKITLLAQMLAEKEE